MPTAAAYLRSLLESYDFRLQYKVIVRFSKLDINTS